MSTWRQRETLAALRRGLAAAWGAVERLEAGVAQERELREALEHRLAAVERELALGRALRRVPLVTAARRLGLSPASVRRLIQSGDLAGAALRLPDRERRVWVVEVQSLARFEREAGAVGAVGAENSPVSRQRGSTAKG